MSAAITTPGRACTPSASQPIDVHECERLAAWQDGYDVGFETAKKVIQSNVAQDRADRAYAIQQMGREAAALHELLCAAGRFASAPRSVLLATAGLAECIAVELARIGGGMQ